MIWYHIEYICLVFFCVKRINASSTSSPPSSFHSKRNTFSSPSISPSSPLSSSSPYIVLIDRSNNGRYDPNKNFQYMRNAKNTAQIIYLPDEESLSKFLLTYSPYPKFSTSPTKTERKNYHILATILSVFLYFVTFQCLQNYDLIEKNPFSSWIEENLPISFVSFVSKIQWRHVGIIYLLYVLEAMLNSSTLKYMSFVVSSKSFQTLLDYWIYQCKPWIIWTLQCFHYQQRRTSSRYNSTTTTTSTDKVVTHRARSIFQFQKWENDIIIKTINANALSSPSSSTSAALRLYQYMNYLQTKNNYQKGVIYLKKRFLPYVKVKLLKMVIVKGGKYGNQNNEYSSNNNSHAVENFMRQKSFLQQMEGGRDLYTEILTSVHVQDFRSHLLVDRTLQQHLDKSQNRTQQKQHIESNKTTTTTTTSTSSSSCTSLIRPTSLLKSKSTSNKLLRLFWIWTLLGFTVPFRIWFHSECDDSVIIIIVKEILQ